MGNNRGMRQGSIKKRTDGRYEIRVTAGLDFKTGLPHRISKYARTRTEASHLLKQLLYAYDVENLKAEDITLYEWLHCWLESLLPNQVKQSTFISYRGYVENHFKPALEKQLLRNITPQILRSFYRYKREQEVESAIIFAMYLIPYFQCSPFPPGNSYNAKELMQNFGNGNVQKSCISQKKRSRTHNPKVVGSNPASGTMISCPIPNGICQLFYTQKQRKAAGDPAAFCFVGKDFRNSPVHASSISFNLRSQRSTAPERAKDANAPSQKSFCTNCTGQQRQNVLRVKSRNIGIAHFHAPLKAVPF